MTTVLNKKKKILLVKKNNKTFSVKFSNSGYSWSEAVVYEKREFWLFSWWNVVWKGNGVHRIVVDKAYPEIIEKLLLEAFNQYEAYKLAWDKNDK